MKTRTVLCALLYWAWVQAQVGGWKENFNDEILVGWEMQNPATFSLQEHDSLLEITYTRTSASWEWDNFNYAPPPVDIAQTPTISLLAKSSVASVLTLKPVYADNRNDWLQAVLPADQAWHAYSFTLTTTGATRLDRIYFYLDGGSKTPSSGTIYFDELCIGDSTRTAGFARRDNLETAMTAANALIASTQEGSSAGQYPIHSKTALVHAINQARSMFDNPTATQQQIDAAVWSLYDACVSYESNVQIINPGMNDGKCGARTRYLYANLANLSGRYMPFGMHDPTGYGVGWSGDDDRSDVKDVCGDYPAVSSWDLNGALNDDETEFARFRHRIISTYKRGGVNSLCWHQFDPEGISFYAENLKYAVVPTVLPGGKYHAFYKERLRRVALFFKSLRGEDGQSIPLLFRPFHEHDGNWFWWGAGPCTASDYNALWRFTHHFLRDSLNVHNLIYTISPSSFNTAADYVKIYPGDDQVDILGMDFYFSETISVAQQSSFVNRLHITAGLSTERHKLPALTEVGQEGLHTIDWHTHNLLPPLKNDSLACKMIYAAVWRNANTSHHFAPYPGHPSVPDFLDFYRDPATWFEKDLPDMYAPVAPDVRPPLFTRIPEQPFIATDTTFAIHLQTDEHASLRYSNINQAYAQMPYEFQFGQNGREHSTLLHGSQGRTDIYYIRAMDLAGNESETLKISTNVDTLQREIPWHHPLYQRREWFQGQAPLGYKSNDNITTTNTSKTVYFYRTFTLERMAASLRILVRCHDGAVVYGNGVELGRIKMPETETITYETSALSAAKNSTLLTLHASQMESLQVGDNLLCIEVHTAGVANPDLSFDACMFVNDTLFFPLGAVWHYYAAGQAPPVLRLADVSTGVGAITKLPVTVNLELNFPNPFNPQTRIRYYLPHSRHVRLRVYDVMGRLTRELVNQKQTAGSYSILFDAGSLASGLYLCCLQCDDYAKTIKMILLR